MRSFRKRFLVTTFVCLLFVSTCVTINIYFPAEKVESVAGEIVSEIRSQEPVKEDESIEKQKNSQDEQDSQEKKDSKHEENALSLDLSLENLLSSLYCSAWADEVTTVSNPTIRALKASMKNRYAQMKPFYSKGILIEGSDGYVSQGNTSALGLKEKRDLGNLISAENKDRERLYQEVAKALKIDPSQTNKIAEIFGKEWQKSVK